MNKNNMDRNLKYSRNEKRVSDNYSKEKLSGEDSTKYGEFVSTFHNWLPIEEQKKKGRVMEDITEDKKDN